MKMWKLMLAAGLAALPLMAAAATGKWTADMPGRDEARKSHRTLEATRLQRPVFRRQAPIPRPRIAPVDPS
jgi:hypothetical protein